MTETPPCPSCGAATVGVVFTALPGPEIGPPEVLHCRGPEPHRITVEPADHDLD